ncbi:MAG: DUF1638 domain-containing protein [Spirochaetales bacterium]|nr:DUF1638 domain-containing protein [Spirochaetales bacterium]
MTQMKYKIIACGVVLDELKLSESSFTDVQELDAGLHLSSGKLHQALQDAIDISRNHYSGIILGFGLCAMAFMGIKARDCPIYIPRTDDCIGLFLGSQNSYDTLRKENPGTYYLSQSWIKRKITVFDDFQRLSGLYGEEQARRMIKLVLRGYSRLVFIDSNTKASNDYRLYARKMADSYGLEYKVVQGSCRFLEKLIHGPWDREFIKIEAGATLNYQDFKKKPSGQGMSFYQSLSKPEDK